MFIPNMPPPVPLLPRRSSADPVPSPSSPQPYSISPLPSPDGNVITRTISRTMQRRKSKSSISSPQSEEERQLASPPKFEAELLEPVPAIPAKYSIEVEEAKRRSQTSPLSIDKALPEEPRNSGAVEVEDVKFSAVPLVPSSPPQQPTSTSSPETPFKEVLLEGQPILGAALGRDAPETTENAIVSQFLSASRWDRSLTTSTTLFSLSPILRRSLERLLFERLQAKLLLYSWRT
jgi:hypothetical protein